MTFSDWIAQVAETVSPNSSNKKGIEETQIALKERELGFALPVYLRQFYEIVGSFRPISDSHSHFVPIDNLRLEGDALVFCVENQGQMVWGIEGKNLHVTDPPVSERPAGEKRWFGACKRTSTFLVHTVCWQAVMAMPVTACADLKKGVVAKLQSLLDSPEEKLQLGYEMFSFMDRKNHLLVSVLRDREFYVGAHTDDAIYDFEKRIGIELDWL